jgi:O-acetyl-ADP-ribose deacetylase (regulator of RNase III)
VQCSGILVFFEVFLTFEHHAYYITIFHIGLHTLQVTSWGGMEVGDGMLFASNVVDGLVHQLGGWKLEWACKWIGKCPEGTAVITGPGNEELAEHYDHIIHTVPPFYHHYDGDADDCLRSCYQESLQLASDRFGAGGDSSSSSSSSSLLIASPLLGAGCRGFPLNVSIDIAATEAIDWMTKSDDSTEMTLAFGIPESSTADDLVHVLNAAFEKDLAGH